MNEPNTHQTDLHVPHAHVNASHAVKHARHLALAVGVLLFLGAGVRTYVNVAHAADVEKATRVSAIKTVLTTHAKPGQGARVVALPATLRGRNEAALYARTNGYVREWKKDIGDKVHKGDVLAIIDTPEVDQDLAQAQAAQGQIKARLNLAETSLTRWEGLRQRDAVSQQELDERRAALQQAQADFAASKAQVKRLKQLHDFARITAPFDGVVVRRNVEVGALVAAGSATNTRELFYLTQTDELRLTVAVPQAYASDVKVGKEVNVKLLERPNAPFKGKIARVSGGVDIATRSVQVEIALANDEGKLLPGAYVEVGLPLSGAAKVLLLPANTLQFRQDGARVAVVGAGGKIALKAVKLGRDLGRSVEVISGITPNDVVVLNPQDTFMDGEKVAAREAPPEKNPSASEGGASKPAAGASAPKDRKDDKA